MELFRGSYVEEQGGSVSKEPVSKQAAERRTGPLGVAFAVIVALSLTSTAFAGKALYERVRVAHQPPPATHLAPGSGSLASAGPPGAFAGLRIYSSTAVPPKFVDVDNDGVEDMVTLVSNATTESPDVYATVLSGKSLTPIWTRGPYAVQAGSPAHLFLAGDRLVLTRTSETLGNAHVLSLRTGGELAAYGLSESFAGACGLADGSRRVKLTSGTVLDLDTGTMSTPPQTPACATEWPRCDSTNGKHCVSRDALSVKGDFVDPGYTYHDEGWNITVGNLKSSMSRARPTVVVLGSARGRVIWDEVLSSVESSEEHAVSATSIGNGRLALLTRETNVQSVVRVIDMKTGDDVWRDAIDEAGTTPMGIHTGASRVYVTLIRGGREEVHVYEADNGKVVGTIADVSSDAKPAPTPGYSKGYYGGYRGTPTVTLGE
jgi:hypothetical protein